MSNGFHDGMSLPRMIRQSERIRKMGIYFTYHRQHTGIYFGRFLNYEDPFLTTPSPPPEY